jgi:hypothetical protein
MSARKPRYSKEEFAKRGDAIFENDIRPHLKNEDDDDFVAIDIETGAYEIDANEMAACDRLDARVPDAQVWLRRVGSPYARSFGGRGRPTNK